MYKFEALGQGNIRVRIVADSVNKNNDSRITTFELRYPRFILSELNTHRMFSRNSASSRAVPVKKFIKQITDMPAMPIHWGLNKAGMQADEEYDGTETEWNPQYEWRLAAESAIEHAEMMIGGDLHKQVTNRLLEPFQFMNTVLTATEFDNFFDLRDHKDAQPEIRELASLMKFALLTHTPDNLKPREWHLPYIREHEELSVEDALKCSSARCARVSYMTHDNENPSIENDLRLYNMLAVRPYDDGKGHVLGENDPIHLSPLEHQAKPMAKMETAEFEKGVTHTDISYDNWSSNFKGWIQYRQTL